MCCHGHHDGGKDGNHLIMKRTFRLLIIFKFRIEIKIFEKENFFNLQMKLKKMNFWRQLLIN